MSGHIVDTHALIWYLGGSSRLSGQARDLLDAAMEGTSRIFIPAIVVAELMMFAEKHKQINPEKIISGLRAMPGIEFLVLLPETAASIRDLTMLPDIHDRLIVAESLVQNLPLISFDERITKSKLVNVVW